MLGEKVAIRKRELKDNRIVIKKRKVIQERQEIPHPVRAEMMAGLRTSKTTEQRCQKLSVFNGIKKQPAGRVKGTRCYSSED